MGDNIINNGQQSNFSFTSQHGTVNTTITNMSVVPQISTRPNTLPINGQHGNNSSFFISDDYAKFSLSTPDLINALATQPFNDGQPSPGTKILDEIFTTHTNTNHPNLSMINPFDRDPVSTTDYQKQENVPTYRGTRKQSQVSLRDRSISSSMNDNESSTSTDSSSPMAYMHPNRVKDELQHVPSMQMKFPGEQNDPIKKEKKRERNRQAAQKCRTRKLTRIAELQKRVNELQGKNKDLTGIAEFLKSDITKLEKQLEDHHTQGCTLMNGSIL